MVDLKLYKIRYTCNLANADFEIFVPAVDTFNAKKKLEDWLKKDNNKFKLEKIIDLENVEESLDWAWGEGKYKISIKEITK